MKLKLFFVFIFIIVLLLSSLKYVADNKYVIVDIDQSKKQKYQEDREKLQDIVNNTYAEGVVVYDVKSGKILSSKNIDKDYSLASLTKIITAVFVYENDKSLINDIRNMLKTSSNEDAIRLANIFSPNTDEQVFYINKRAEKYHLHFRNVSGLDIILDKDDNRLAGGIGKPMDFINFMKDYYLKYPEIFDQTMIKENNTNLSIDKMDFVSASKTGFTNLSGGNLFVNINKGLNKDMFILVLNSTEKNRFVDVQNISNFLLQSSI